MRFGDKACGSLRSLAGRRERNGCGRKTEQMRYEFGRSRKGRESHTEGIG